MSKYFVFIIAFSAASRRSLSLSKRSLSPSKGSLNLSKGSLSPSKGSLSPSKGSLSSSKGSLSLSGGGLSPSKGSPDLSKRSLSLSKGSLSSSKGRLDTANNQPGISTQERAALYPPVDASPLLGWAKARRFGYMFASSSSMPSMSNSSPVAMKTVRSQMLVTRSAMRSRLWMTHIIRLTWSIVSGWVIMSSTIFL